MSQSGSWVPKGDEQSAREAAREAARSEGLTLGEYLDRLMKSTDGPQPNEIQPTHGKSRPRAETASEALEKLTRRIEASEARSALAISSMDQTIHDMVARLQNTQHTTAAIAGHVEGVIDQLRETHDALKQKVRRLEEDDSQQENLEALKALESALGKLAQHVYDENDLAQQEAQAIKGRVESGFMDIIERVEAMETRVETSLTDTAKQVREGVEQATLRAASTARHLTEQMEQLEVGVEARFSALEGSQERLDTTEARLGTVETNVSDAMESMETKFDQIHDRLNRAETTTDAALKNLETSFSSLDERIDDVASKVDPDLADRLRSEFEARFEDLMTSVRETVDTVRQELAEEIARTAAAPAEAIEKVSEQVTALNETFDTRLREVEEQSDSAASEAVREEIERLGKTVSDRIDELAEDLTQRVADSEARSADAIEQIGDQVVAANNRLQARQNEAIRTLAEQVDENRKKADARLSDALANVSDRLEQVQLQANASLSPVQKAIAMLAARLEGLEDSTLPPGALSEDMSFTGDFAQGSDSEDRGDDPIADISFDDFETPEEFEDFEGFGAFDDLEDAARAEAPVELPVAMPAQEVAEEDERDDAVAFESGEDYAEVADDVFEDDAGEFEAGIQSWDATPEEAALEADDVADEVSEETEAAFEDDFDAIRAAVEGLSFAHQETLAETDEDDEADIGAEVETSADGDAGFSDDPDQDIETELEADAEDFIDPLTDEDTFPDPLDELDGLDEAHTEARESDIFDDEEFEVMELETAAEAPPPAEDKPLDSDTADYLSRARKAAMAANFGKSPARARPGTRTATSGGASRLPLIAAASAVAVVGVAAGGYLYIRGKQEPPVQQAPASTYVDPGAPETAASAAAVAAEDEDLFETPAAEDTTEAPAAELAQPTAGMTYAPIPSAVSVEAAAASGNSIAQYQLAQDKLTAGDFAGGADLMRKSAQKGLPIAQYALAKLHEKGTGVPKDLGLAREWTEKAAEGGNVKAMHDLAVFMAEGEGGEQTYAGAVEWFRKGAEYGVVDSQYNLGVLYEQGLGISPNLTESLFWFDVASRNGDGGAPSKIAELIERVSPEAAAQARSRSASWQPAAANSIANGRFGAQPWNMGNPLQVQAIQKALTALGYDIGVPDGIMGPATSMAIREYQGAHNLALTGTVTPALIESLNAGASAR